MPKGVAYHVDEDPPEWIEECMQCPFDECVDSRYQASAYHCVTSIRGCMQEEKFISMYNSGEKPRTIGIAFGVPTSFVLSVIDVLNLPWKAGKIRPKISRTTMKSLPEKYQFLFC